MIESVIATFDDVKFIQGITPMTQPNWQKYFKTAIKNGIYEGLDVNLSFDGLNLRCVINDGTAIANGICASVKTELGYTPIDLPTTADVKDQFICLRIYFISSKAELIAKRNIAEPEYEDEHEDDMLIRTMFEFQYNESYMCTRNNQYWELPIFYSAGPNTVLRAGRSLRRPARSEPNYTMNPDTIGIIPKDDSLYLLSGTIYCRRGDNNGLTIYPDAVDVTQNSVITMNEFGSVAYLRLDRLPFVNNILFARQGYDGFRVPDRLPGYSEINYFFSNENWSRRDWYYEFAVPAGEEKVFRVSYRGATKSIKGGSTAYSFNFFVEDTYNYQSVIWGGIGGSITDQADLSQKLNYLDNTKCSLDSPAFTGEPTAPTPASSDNSTKLATTAFVNSLIPDVPSIDGLAPLASPSFTGTPTAPTPASGDNSTKLATTAFVKSVIPDIPRVIPAKHIDYIDYFVDSNRGDDNNSGKVSSKPVKNIQTAINKCPIGGKCHIHVFDGTYNRIYIPRDKYVLITAVESKYAQEQGIVNLYYEGEFDGNVSVVFVEGVLEIRGIKLTITSGTRTIPMSVRNGGKLFVNYKDVYTRIGGDCTLSLINGSDYYSSLLVDNSSSAVLMPKTLFINSAITCAGSSHVSLLVRPKGAIQSSYIPVFDVRGGGILSYVGSDVSGGSQTVRSDGTSLVLLGEFSQD